MEQGNKFLDYFQGKCIFITGCTGSIGMALLEKFLRDFPQVRKIVLLIRSRKSNDVALRKLNYFENPLFSVMKKARKDYLEKIVWVEGDVVYENLGLSEENLDFIYNNVNVVYHCAASVKLKDSLKNLVTHNVYGTEMVYKLAKKCKYVECFMYISTIFSNHRFSQFELKEQIYENPIKPENLLEMVKRLSAEEFEEFCKESKSWLCNYVFSKNAAENLIGSKKDSIKKGILRIGSVMETYKEPFPSWLINGNGFNVILKNAGTGIIFYKLNEKACVYCTPIDLCINALIASTYDTAHITDNLKVYNVAINRPTVKEIYEIYIKENVNDPWLIFGSLKYRFLCHLKDLVLEMSGKRGIYVREMEMLGRLIEISQDIVLKELHCYSDNLDALWKGLNENEKKLLFFDINQIDFEKYIKNLFRSNETNAFNPTDVGTSLLNLSKL